jgi:hypothetical protein
MEREVRMFFFEKKNQKTFTSSQLGYPCAAGAGHKSLLLLFFRKEGLT